MKTEPAEIIHCKDCAYRGNHTKCPMCNKCNAKYKPTLDEDFCSRGKKKEVTL